MSNPLNLSLSIEWKEVESDHTMCCVCDQLMIGIMFQQVLIVDRGTIYQETKVCKYCYTVE